jgi:hypothetical protein
MSRLFSVAVLVASAALCSSEIVSAQNTMLQASFGSTELRAGFTPDPYTRSLTAGGSVAVADRFTNCSGYIAEAPDFQLSYNAGALPLIFSVDAGSDTTLVINDPSGAWWCDDDGASGLNPAVRFDDPRSGRYDVWVGTFSSGSGAPATLFVSETGIHARASGRSTARVTANSGNRMAAHTGSGRRPVSNTSAGLDINLPSRFGSINLNGGFMPDPASRTVSAGGPVSAQDALPGVSGCTGSVSSAPTIELRYAGSDVLHIYTSGSTDTTLVINAPDGNWYCNDDAPGLGTNAGLSLRGSGTYDIYVGSYSGSSDRTRLMVSEVGIGYGG